MSEVDARVSSIYRQALDKVVALPISVRRMMLMALDAFAWVLALLVFVVVRYDFQLSGERWTWVLVYTLAAIVLQLFVGLATQLYLGRSRVGSFGDATGLSVTVLLTSLPLGALMVMLVPAFPRGVGLFMPPLALVFMAAGRWFMRVLLTSRPRNHGSHAVPALVYGAGDAGHEVARLVDTAEDAPYSIVGFVDDDASKRFLRVRNHRVFGTGADLVDVAQRREAETVILAISKASPRLIQDVADRCERAGLDLVVIPPVRDMINGKISLGDLREFNVTDLLGRRPISTDLSKISSYLNGKVVLITGAGGSIGSELARQVRTLGPSKLILLDRDESALHAVQLSLYGSGLLDTDDMVLCDIRDREDLQAVFEGHRPQVVFHAAALKHLPMLERFPREGWKTNVLGSLNVLQCAHQVGVVNFVNISTDKAADASSVLGRTKRLAERLTAWYGQTYDLPYVSVRFGNVLGSRGSVFYTFLAQIERGGPITVTHPDVTRYFMTIPEACQLVLQAGAIGQPGDAMVLDMGEPIKIVDVAERLIAESGKRVKVEFTGLRQGEKLHEALFSTLESGIASEHPLISSVTVTGVNPDDLPRHPKTKEEIMPYLGQQLTPATAGSQATEAQEVVAL